MNKLQAIFVLFLVCFFGYIFLILIDTNKIPYIETYKSQIFLVFGSMVILILVAILQRMRLNK
jgi:hypothetical protein